jgi:tungstate transport system substrate-binding protein
MKSNSKSLIFIINLLVIFSIGLAACSQNTGTPPAPAPTPSSQAPTAYAIEIPTLDPAAAYPAMTEAVATELAKPTATSSSQEANPANKEIILATTSSTQDSGLLDVLLPAFEKKTGYTVKPVAVGSGQALLMGEQGNADLLLVHDPTAEGAFMDKGAGIERQLVMHNDFVIVGPAADPAGIKGTSSAADAFIKIAAAKAIFISRGDISGTSTAELKLWKAAGLSPTQSDAWYLSTGQGMGATLQITSEKGGYTLTDRATYLANKANLSLDILVEKDPVLLNIYHVIIVNPEKWPKINLDGARAFAAYLVSPEGQALIGSYGVDKFGQALFTPDAGKKDSDLSLP